MVAGCPYNILFKVLRSLPFASPPVAMPCPCKGWCRCAFNWRDLRAADAEKKAHWRRLSQWARREARREANREEARREANREMALRGEAPLPPPPDDDDKSPFGCDCIERRCSCKSQPGEHRRPKRRRW